MSSCDDRLSEWRELLGDQRSSGMSVKEWCESEGISTNTYYYWRKRLSVASAASSAPASPLAPGWLPVTLDEAPSCSSGLTLRVGRVFVDVSRGFDAGLLSSLLNVLEARRC
jgi:transposase-like protein